MNPGPGTFPPSSVTFPETGTHFGPLGPHPAVSKTAPSAQRRVRVRIGHQYRDGDKTEEPGSTAGSVRGHDFTAGAGAESVVNAIVDRGSEEQDAPVAHDEVRPARVFALVPARPEPVRVHG